MDNDKGFIMPITLIVVFILFSYVTFQINQLIVEKAFYNEQNKLYTAERLIQMAVVDLKELLQMEVSDEISGKFYYEEGEVSYIIKLETDLIWSIAITSKPSFGSMKKLNYFYNKNEETFLRWLEER